MSITQPTDTQPKPLPPSDDQVPISPDSSSQTGPAPNDEGAYSIFTPRQRTYLTYLLGIVITLSTLTATIYFPLIPLLSTQLSVPIQSINLTVTIYAICQALSPALFASLADTYGRRPVLLSLILLYALASLGLSLNTRSYSALIGLRALQSIGGSATPAIAYGIVADVAVVAERGRMLGPLLATCNGISAAGPVIGGAVALKTDGVKWVFLALLVLAVGSFLAVGGTLPETARGVVGNGSLPVRGVWRTWMSFLPSKARDGREKGAITRPLVNPGQTTSGWDGVKNLGSAFRIILQPNAAAVLWTVASSYSIYYTFQVAIPAIFSEIYLYNELQIGLIFLPGLAGMTIGGIIAGKLVDHNYVLTAKKHNIVLNRTTGDSLLTFPLEEARYRHYLLYFLIETLLVVGYGWAVKYRVHAAVPIVMQFFICALSTLLSHTASVLLVDIFPDRSSSAYAAGQVVRCGLSAASAAVMQPLVKAVGWGWYFTIFALFLGGSAAGAVIVSQVWGMGWRRRRWLRDSIEDTGSVLVVAQVDNKER